MKNIETFLDLAKKSIKWPNEKTRAETILTKWAAAWQGTSRNLTLTRSIHGSYLHFNQLIGGTWCKAFTFHACRKHGISLRGPDTDRTRKSHKLRANPLDTRQLDKLFETWQKHPETHPAGNAVELFFDEAPDHVWDAFLQEALACLNEAEAS